MKGRERMSASPSSSALRLLRAQIESRLNAPASIVVTSAAKGDGKSVTACGLADSFVAARYRTLIVKAGGNRYSGSFPDETIGEPAGGLSVRSRSERFDEIVIPLKSAQSFSRDAIALLVDEFRSVYDYTIIDTPALFEDDAALLFAGAASGTLITVRLDRPRVADDFRIYPALEAVNAPVLGVVAVSEKLIKEFAKTDDPHLAALPSAFASQLKLHRHPVEVPHGAHT